MLGSETKTKNPLFVFSVPPLLCVSAFHFVPPATRNYPLATPNVDNSPRAVAHWLLMHRTLPLALALLLVAGCSTVRQWHEDLHARLHHHHEPLSLPPAPPREFRAAWVATVGNIDWPSKPNLTPEQQRAEMTAILDKAADLHLNAIILQVRTSFDAFYSSDYEPWSEYLTGKQGVPPSPFYDPLSTWIAEAHRRGIELHAWFNPYRARRAGAKSPDAPDHIANTHPEVVRKFNGWRWLDPAEPDAREHTLRVIADVVRRYDIDGVHLDDYFYPYPEYLTDKETKKVADFPDDPSYKRYKDAGGTLERADWRRDNVNRMIRDLYAGIKHLKPHVKFGVSPFGIWRPGNPENVKGFDQYDKLYADARLWLNNGWCDYWTPQLYWRLDAPDQPFADLLKWWDAENTHHRHLWPGLYDSRVIDSKNPWPAQEIVDQIDATRAQEGPASAGNVHFSMVAFMKPDQTLPDLLKSGPYAQAALVPATPWIDSTPMAAPRIQANQLADGSIQVVWENQDNAEPWQWAVWARGGDQWRFATYPSVVRSVHIVPEAGHPITAVNVASVDRNGNANFAMPLRIPVRHHRNH